ncbi:MbtH family NRPS accessory protein [Streptomyces sp. NPDC088730]|uniref:MbtH family NRPS accessory protein n=1 Tax=Streptomyces sp. NPDC088730 TaxID=3365877 RepID=UPI0037FAA76F
MDLPGCRARDAEDQPARWPSFAGIPAGWRAMYGPAGRAACLGYVEVHRTGLTPRSARVAMA